MRRPEKTIYRHVSVGNLISSCRTRRRVLKNIGDIAWSEVNTVAEFLYLGQLLRRFHRGGRDIPMSRATLYRMIAEGRFPKLRRFGKRSVWTTEDIDRWRERWLEGADA